MAESVKPKKRKRIQWHPAYCSAAELEFIENRADLEFKREVNISKKPLQIDLTIIEKKNDVQIKNELGYIFKRYNIFEFKGPGDYVTIDDYYKVIGYACLYKSLSDRVNAIPASEITITLMQEKYPHKLFQILKSQGLDIQKRANGIYTIGNPLPFYIQIAVIKELDESTHCNFRVLTKDASVVEVSTFLRSVMGLREKFERELIESVLDVSMYANNEIYRTMDGENSMSEIFRELLDNELARAVKQAKAEARAEAKAEAESKLEEARAEAKAEAEARVAKVEAEKEKVEAEKEKVEAEKEKVEAEKEKVEAENKQEIFSIAYSLKEMGLSIEAIAKAVKRDVDTVKQWFALGMPQAGVV